MRSLLVCFFVFIIIFKRETFRFEFSEPCYIDLRIKIGEKNKQTKEPHFFLLGCFYVRLNV